MTPKPPNQFNALICDLDGTLLNTLDDLADSMNAVLESMSCPTHPTDAYKTFVGNGVRMLALRALPAAHRTDTHICEALTRMRTEYSCRWADKTRPYPGVAETLTTLRSRGIKLAVLSNKQDDFTHLTVEKLLDARWFDAVAGVTDERPCKPDPAGALQIARQFGLPPESIAYLGDTNTDMQTAHAAGMFAIGAVWGFRTADELLAHGAQTLAHHPGDLLTIL